MWYTLWGKLACARFGLHKVHFLYSVKTYPNYWCLIQWEGTLVQLTNSILSMYNSTHTKTTSLNWRLKPEMLSHYNMKSNPHWISQPNNQIYLWKPTSTFHKLLKTLSNWMKMEEKWEWKDFINFCSWIWLGLLHSIHYRL